MTNPLSLERLYTLVSEAPGRREERRSPRAQRFFDGSTARDVCDPLRCARTIFATRIRPAAIAPPETVKRESSRDATRFMHPRACIQNRTVLAPVALASNLGFATVELRRVQRLVAEHEPRLLEAWNEYFGESRGRACEGRPIYRGRPGGRSPGWSDHRSAAGVVPAPSLGDSRATR